MRDFQHHLASASGTGPAVTSAGLPPVRVAVRRSRARIQPG